MSKKPRKTRKPRARTRTKQKLRGLDSRDLDELKLARSLWANNRFNESLHLFDKTAKKYPSHLLALVDAARAFGARYEIARAEELAASLVSKCGTNAEHLLLAGQTYRMIGRSEEAIACLEDALAIDPSLSDSRLELALLYDRKNDLARAAGHVSECLARSNNSAEASYLKGHLLRRQGELDAARELLLKLGNDESVHPLVRTKSLYEVASLLDASGNYDSAFEIVQRAKKIQHVDSNAAWQENDRETTGFANLLEQLTETDFHRWSDHLKEIQKEDFVFLTGVPRSGTTLLERVLKSHPRVTSTDEEVALPRYILPNLMNYQAKEQLSVANLDNILRSKILAERERYFRYMSAVLKTDVRQGVHIDKNPSLVRLMPAVIRLFPEAKILFSIRDPRDVLVSCFMRYLPINSVSVGYLTLSQTVEAVTAELSAWKRIREIIPNEHLEVRYEDMVHDLESTSRKAIRFLGVDWDDSVLNYRQSKSIVHSPTYEDVAKPIYKSAIGRWKNYRKHLEPFLPELESVVSNLGYE